MPEQSSQPSTSIGRDVSAGQDFVAGDKINGVIGAIWRSTLEMQDKLSTIDKKLDLHCAQSAVDADHVERNTLRISTHDRLLRLIGAAVSVELMAIIILFMILLTHIGV